MRLKCNLLATRNAQSSDEQSQFRKFHITAIYNSLNSSFFSYPTQHKGHEIKSILLIFASLRRSIGNVHTGTDTQ